MEKYQVEVKGIAPLLMNKFNNNETSSGRGKKKYDPQEEAERKAYRTNKGELYLPNTHFKAAMVKAGADIKMSGRKTCKDFVKAGLFIKENEIVLDIQEYTIHEEPVVIQRARVMSWRPRLDEWSCKFTIELIDTDYLNGSLVKQILENAGLYKGVGDHRPEYGRFEVVTFKKLK